MCLDGWGLRNTAIKSEKYKFQGPLTHTHTIIPCLRILIRSNSSACRGSIEVHHRTSRHKKNFKLFIFFALAQHSSVPSQAELLEYLNCSRPLQPHLRFWKVFQRVFFIEFNNSPLNKEKSNKIMTQNLPCLRAYQ